MPIHLRAPRYDGRGPDGQGWNRLSITGGSQMSGDQCALRPTSYATLRESLDTRRARHGGFGPCVNSGNCNDSCRIYAARPRSLPCFPTDQRVLVRIIDGRPWVMASPDIDSYGWIWQWEELRCVEGWEFGPRADDELGEAFWLIRAQEGAGS